jgi:hypothetical protein
MSGHDETSLPPDGGEVNPPPQPPRPAPPNFGRSSAAGGPPVVFQTTDTQQGIPAFSDPSVASDAEETMTPPRPQRPGAPMPDAHQQTPAPHESAGTPTENERTTTGGTSPRDAAPAESGTPPYGTPGQGVPPYGTPVPEAERTVAEDRLPRDQAARPGVPPAQASGTPRWGTPAGDAPLPEAERTVSDDPRQERPGGAAPGPGTYGVPIHDAANGPSEAGPTDAGTHPGMPGTEATGAFTDANGQKTLAVVRLGADSHVSSATFEPPLTPDAILPPGMTPQAPPDASHDIGATSTGPIPRLGSGGSSPGGPGPGGTPPNGHGRGGSSGARRALLVAGGLVAALVLGGGGALAVTQLSGGSGDEPKVTQSQAPPVQTQVAPTPTPSPSKTRPKHKPKPVPVDIRDEKKDPKPLTVIEVFPSAKLTLAGHKFTRAKTVINDLCSLTANGPFAQELTREHCRRVVRATFVSDDKKLAVTAGIAVMPTDAAARAMLKVQDPAHYKWFRGMKATGAPKIDQAGGFAASTLRGRYISYAYATYADGHKPAADDKTLKAVGKAFRDSTARPIERRAKH